MKRELKDVKRCKFCSGCCPGHDDYPDSTYSSRRSKRARSRGKKVERRYVRRLKKQQLGDAYETLETLPFP